MDILGNFSDLRGDKKQRRLKKKELQNFDYGDTAIEKVGQIENKREKVNLSAVKYIAVLIFCVLAIRVFGLQVIRGEENKLLAEGNSIRPRLIEAPRGQILDNGGNWLARNTYDFSVALYPSDLPKKKVEREKYYNQISELISVPQEEVKINAEKNGLVSLDMAIIKEDISHEESLLLEERLRDYPGLFIAKRYKRQYNYTVGMGHIFGYTGIISKDELEKGIGYYASDRVGKSGTEKTAENYLRGSHGVEQVEVDSRGNINRILLNSDNRQPVPGSDVWLYLDGDLQKKAVEIAQNSLVTAREATGFKDIISANVLVMDIKTGGVLAMVSTPDYDPNLFAGKDSAKEYAKIVSDPDKPMFNRSIGGIYPPGSISKPILACAALQERTITSNTWFDTPASISIGDYTYGNFEGKTLGPTNVVTALEKSNNVFFYAVGGGYGPIKGLGIERIKKYWQLFGLGEKTGIDLTGESSGLLPDPVWKKKVQKMNWYIGDTYHISIGQGDLLVTPVQMLRAIGSIGNGGKLLVPHMVKKATDTNGQVIFENTPEVIREDFISTQNLMTVQKGMRQVVTDGTARSMASLSVEVAGKSGSAQYQNNERVHSWFGGYAPYDDPQIAILTMVEGGGMSTEAAIPMAKQVIDYYFNR